jgi:hypothetical protein
VEVVEADDAPCVTVIESQVDMQGEHMSCITGQDHMKYDYMSVGKGSFIPINVKPTTSATRLIEDAI